MRKSLVTRIVPLLLLLGSLSFSSFAKAAETIVFVDTQEVVSTSEVIKDIMGQLEKKTSSYQVELNKKAKALQEEGQKLNEEHTLLSDEKYSQKRQEFDNKEDALQREVQQKSLVFDRAYADALKVVNDKLHEIVKELAAEKGFNIALHSSAAIYIKDGLDVSDIVLKRLNASLSKLKVQFDTKP